MLFGAKKNLVVGVIGLGIIGTRVCQLLRGAGYTVYVYNRSPRAVPNFLGSAAQVAEHCQVIQLFVRDSHDLVEVVERLAAPGGPLGNKHVVINSATVSPEAVERAGTLCASRGAGFVNAPFMGSKGASEKGDLVYFAGGASEEALKRALPVLEVSSREIVAAPGAREAALMKLAANMLVSVQVAALAEVLGLVERGGVDPATFLKALTPTVAKSPVMEMKAPGMLAGEFEPHFTLANMLKDARLSRDAAQALGQATPLGETVFEVFTRGLAAGLGDLDFSAVAKLYQAQAAPVEPVIEPPKEEATPVIPLEIKPLPEEEIDALPRPGHTSRLERDVRGKITRRITLTETEIQAAWEPVKKQLDLPVNMPPPPPAAPQPVEEPRSDPAFTFSTADLASLPPEEDSPVVTAKGVYPQGAPAATAASQSPKRLPITPLRRRREEDQDP